MMNGFYGYGYNGGWMSPGPILWIIFCLVMLYFIVQWMKESQNEQKSKTSLDILKERYAKGEITKEEFENMKKDLQETE